MKTSLRIGAAVKHTVTDKYALLYAGGTDKFKSEPGAEAVLDYMLKLAENVIYVMKAEAFSVLRLLTGQTLTGTTQSHSNLMNISTWGSIS